LPEKVPNMVGALPELRKTQKEMEKPSGAEKGERQEGWTKTFKLSKERLLSLVENKNGR